MMLTNQFTNHVEDLEKVDNIMRSRGLLNDPAFSQTQFQITPLACMDGCPVGLYRYNENLIQLPPGFSEGTVLHELGHRFGHYYHDDLSEAYAEDYRKQFVGYFPDRLVIAEGFTSDLIMTDWPRMDKFFPPGSKGEMAFYLPWPLTDNDLLTTNIALAEVGLHAQAIQVNGRVSISFTQGYVPFFLTLSTLGFLVNTESGTQVDRFIVYSVTGSLVPFLVAGALLIGKALLF